MGKAEYDGVIVNVHDGNVTITNEQFREYCEMKADRDRTVLSLRAQMSLQNANALRLAREVNGALIGSGLGLSIVNMPAMQRAHELAQEILTGE